MAKIKTSFSGHDKFDCKVDWITKGLLAFRNNPNIFSQANIENSIEILGLGINMIKSLNHWMKNLGIIDNGKLTDLGLNIIDNDIYLENIDTLWMLHWNLVKNSEQSTLYNMFFNKIYPYKFSKNDLVDNLKIILNENDIALSPVTLSADIDVFIKMYNDSNSMSLFSDLNIITSLTNGYYSLNINATSKISDIAFLYILCDYINMIYDDNIKSISVDDLQRGILSLQKSLCISESTLYNKIYKLSEMTHKSYSYSESAGMKQIYINNPINKLDILDSVYKG